jgi:CheY-like chemotaxis protein
LTILVHAEHIAASSPERRITISSHRVGKKIALQFVCPQGQFPEAHDRTPSKTDYFGLPVAQVIVQSHEGDLRSALDSHGHPRFVLELPIAEEAGGEEEAPVPASRPTRVLTCLLVEPDPAAQRRALSMLAVRGHRAVPVNGAEEAVELVQRMQFAAILCSSRMPGLSWTEFHQRVRRRAGAFGVIADSWDSTAAQLASDAQVQVLASPVTDDALDSFLALAEVRIAAARP